MKIEIDLSVEEAGWLDEGLTRLQSIMMISNAPDSSKRGLDDFRKRVQHLIFEGVQRERGAHNEN